MEKSTNQIDHIIIDKRKASSMLDVKSCREANSDSHHILVRGRYRCKMAYSKHKPNRTIRRLHVATLREASTVRRFSSNWKKNSES